jgi:hypothetical protein
MKNNTITIQETTNKNIIKFASNQILINRGSYEFNNIDEAKNLSISAAIILFTFCEKGFYNRQFYRNSTF